MILTDYFGLYHDTHFGINPDHLTLVKVCKPYVLLVNRLMKEILNRRKVGSKTALSTITLRFEMDKWY